jgi:hypothetical protein
MAIGQLDRTRAILSPCIDVGAVRQHLVENIPRSVRLWPLLANFLGNQTVA